ncbi:hypothetical protein [Ilumatobacter sp.]
MTTPTAAGSTVVDPARDRRAGPTDVPVRGDRAVLPHGTGLALVRDDGA